MDETRRMSWLRIVLRIASAGMFMVFTPWIALILLKAPILAPGGTLAPLLRFQPYNAYYESMMTVVYMSWAIMLWRASNNPAQHRLFIDFTILANAAHGVVMLIATPMQKGLIMTAVEGLPLLMFAAVLWLLRPRVESGEELPSNLNRQHQSREKINQRKEEALPAVIAASRTTI